MRFRFRVAKAVREFNDNVFAALNNLNTDYVFNLFHHAPAVAGFFN